MKTKPRIAARGRRQGALPDKGFKRNEELKRRQEDLEQLAETLPEAYTIDPAALELDHETMRVNMEDVPGALPDYIYLWQPPDNEVQFNTVQAIGWEVVKGDMPEAMAFKDVYGYRRKLDSILLRMRKDKAMLVQQRRRLTHAHKDGAGDGNFMELADKWKRLGGRVHVIDKRGDEASQVASELLTHMTALQMKGMTYGSSGKNPQLRKAIQQRMLRDLATSDVSGTLRRGGVPGVDPQEVAQLQRKQFARQ